LEEKIEKRWKELRKIGECRPRASAFHLPPYVQMTKKEDGSKEFTGIEVN
jgi:hypothetical protein